MKLLDEIRNLEEEMIADRRSLHKMPELSSHEEKTTAFIKTRLTDFGVETEDLNIPTGVCALIRGRKPGPTICIRHDIDALPIEEKTGLEFSSLNKGVSHSCGHDLHAIIALYCARLLQERKESLAGNVRIVFQPAEETGVGGKEMVMAGIMDLEPKTDIVVGLHTHPATTVGDICLWKGPMEAGVDFFKIRIQGVCGHGAHPHTCVDPIVVSAYLITQLQTIISRENQATKPVVLTIGSIHGGETHNSIPEEVVMLGSLRHLYPETRGQALEALDRITKSTCESMRAYGTVEVLDVGIPPIINNADVVDDIIRAADEVLGSGHVKDFPFPSMGSDDFAFFLDRCKGAQFFLGTGNNNPQTRKGIHNGENIFDEKSIAVGVSVLTKYVLNVLKGDELDG